MAASGGSIAIDVEVRDKATQTIRRLRGQVKDFGRDTEKAMTKVQKAGKKLDAFGKSAMKVGRQMSMKVSLPLAGAGAAAFKMAVSYTHLTLPTKA